MRLAFCWSHARRRVYELAAADSAPIALEALKRIKGLYAIGGEIRSMNPEARLAARQLRSRPVVVTLEPWLRSKLATISR